jgi:hypothetical protein
MSKLNYMEKVDAWLTEEIQKLLDNWPGYEGQEGFDAFKKVIKDKILESFRNGQRSARRSPKENETTSEVK